MNERKQQTAKAIRDYLLARPDRRVTLKELCEEVPYSGTYLKNCFRETYGVPLATYARQQKMWHACRLLRETELPILQIAGDLGYENGSKFANAFRGILGVTPREYRKAREEEAFRILAASQKVSAWSGRSTEEG